MTGALGHSDSETEDANVLFDDLLGDLRIHRIDYIVIHPYNDDRFFLCLTAALTTLQKWANHTGMPARLKTFRTPLEKTLLQRSADVPVARFELSHVNDFLPFRSRDRIQLMCGLLEHKERCAIDFNRMIHLQLMSDHFAVHHQHERRLVYTAWAAPWSAAPIWPPNAPETFLSEEKDVVAKGEVPLAGYLGEHMGFELMYFAFYVLWLLLLAVPGILIFFWRSLIAGPFYPEKIFVEMASHVEVTYSYYAMLCAFLLGKFWSRRENLLALRWSMWKAYALTQSHLQTKCRAGFAIL